MMDLSGGGGCSLGINQYLVDHFALLGGDEMLGSSPILRKGSKQRRNILSSVGVEVSHRNALMTSVIC